MAQALESSPRDGSKIESVEQLREIIGRPLAGVEDQPLVVGSQAHVGARNFVLGRPQAPGGVLFAHHEMGRDVDSAGERCHHVRELQRGRVDRTLTE